MNETIYDTHVQFYLDFVDRALADEASLWHRHLSWFTEILGDRLHGARVCDIACGEGYLSRFLSRLGPREVIGIDLSAALVAAAVRRSDGPNLSYRVEDAQHLRTVPDASVDIAACQMAMMDIPDHQALFRAVRRVLTPGGVFAFSLLHPCFEAPFRIPDQPQFQRDTSGAPIAYVVRRYASEGFWRSDGTGVRGHVGAYHRTLSTLLNDLLAVGFVLDRLDEPLVRGGGLFAQVPQTLLVAAHVN